MGRQKFLTRCSLYLRMKRCWFSRPSSSFESGGPSSRKERYSRDVITLLNNSNFKTESVLIKSFYSLLCQCEEERKINKRKINDLTCVVSSWVNFPDRIRYEIGFRAAYVENRCVVGFVVVVWFNNCRNRRIKWSEEWVIWMADQDYNWNIERSTYSYSICNTNSIIVRSF
jgi:hypothetical protein